MPTSNPITLLFVHGWSVTHTNTYGQLPARLAREAAAAGYSVEMKDLWLGKYVSFHDEVQLDDISVAFEAALNDAKVTAESNRKVVCITHSTGGPVIRNWFFMYHYVNGKFTPSPITHLVMLAPANFGSALAILGKSRLARIKSWFEDVDPGTGVLNWLELGSPESFRLNTSWMRQSERIATEGKLFHFVLTGQSIDRSLYDHINTYTGEMGSDGVVRAAAANLNATYVRYVQDAPKKRMPAGDLPLRLAETFTTGKAPFALVAGRSHSGDDMGIMRSVVNNNTPHPTVDLLMQCIGVSDATSYNATARSMDAHTQAVEAEEIVEKRDRMFLSDRVFYHDPCSMVVFRVLDDTGRNLEDFDIIFTAKNADGSETPNYLPKGFLIDKQRNSRDRSMITFYFNYALMQGYPAIDKHGEQRPEIKGPGTFGFIISPSRTKGFVHHWQAVLEAKEENIDLFFKPHRTTVIDIVMKRIVKKNVFRLTNKLDPESFKNVPPGNDIA